jgi:hypothetical protein
MNKKFGVIFAVVSIGVFVLSSCNLFPPQNSLRLASAPYYTDLGGNIRIHFHLENIGSDTLKNCKVKWYVDVTPGSTIEFDEVTAWAPTLGVNLSPGGDRDFLTVDTTTGITFASVENFGVYAWGWENPPDE